MNSAGTGDRRSTPTVLWAVSAVIAVMPWTPQRANAFRSAWIPAPPPESEPAIESTAGRAGLPWELGVGRPRPPGVIGDAVAAKRQARGTASHERRRE